MKYGPAFYFLGISPEGGDALSSHHIWTFILYVCPSIFLLLSIFIASLGFGADTYLLLLFLLLGGCQSWAEDKATQNPRGVVRTNTDGRSEYKSKDNMHDRAQLQDGRES
jgi:hypothetical protein